MISPLAPVPVPRQRTAGRRGVPLDRAGRTRPSSTGGHCQLLASWAHVAGEDWRQRLERWFAGTGCDAYVLEREALDPAAHAASWLRQTEQTGTLGRRLRRVDALQRGAPHRGGRFRVDHDAQAGRRPAWFRAEEAPQDVVMPCGDHLGAVFELADFLDAPRDDRLLSTSLRRRARRGARRAQRTAERTAGQVVERRLRQTAGLCHSGDVDPASPRSSSPATADGRSARSSQASPPRPGSRSPRCAPRCRSSAAWSSRPSCSRPDRRADAVLPTLGGHSVRFVAEERAATPRTWLPGVGRDSVRLPATKADRRSRRKAGLRACGIDRCSGELPPPSSSRSGEVNLPRPLLRTSCSA